MPIVRGEYAERLAPGLIMRSFNRYREKPEQYRQVNNVRDSSKAYEEDFAYTGFGPLAPKEELAQTIMDQPIKLGGVRFIHRGWALGFVISEEMRDDEQYGLMMDLAGELGRSSRYTAELWGHDVWNHAFDTKYLGRDGLPLIHAAHPVAGTGGVIANRPAIDADLSQPTLETAWADFQMLVDDRGIPMDMQPSFLFVHPTKVMLARRLLDSSGYESAAHAGIINPVQGLVRIVSSPYLLDPDAWFIGAELSEIDVRFYWRKKPDTKTWDDEDVDGTIHKIKQRHSVGFGDWRGVYGSPGTGAPGES